MNSVFTSIANSVTLAGLVEVHKNESSLGTMIYI